MFPLERVLFGFRGRRDGGRGRFEVWHRRDDLGARLVAARHLLRGLFLARADLLGARPRNDGAAATAAVAAVIFPVEQALALVPEAMAAALAAIILGFAARAAGPVELVRAARLLAGGLASRSAGGFACG